LEEAFAQNRRQGLPVAAALPVVLTCVEIWLNSVLDLSAEGLRNTLGIGLERILNESRDEPVESMSQALGRLAWQERFEGLLVPSAADRPLGVNLVVFPDLLGPGQVTIVNEHHLPTVKGIADLQNLMQSFILCAAESF
jgi:hypothetical protein